MSRFEVSGEAFADALERLLRAHHVLETFSDIGEIVVAVPGDRPLWCRCGWTGERSGGEGHGGHVQFVVREAMAGRLEA